jgi:catechol 2,3-dioxygenase-like lactoylglutathione lyase family enzyme
MQALIGPVRHGTKGQTMRTYLDSKTIAKGLRQSLAAKNVTLSHSECLELVAQMFGFGNWNVLASKIDLETGVRKPTPRDTGIELQPPVPVLSIVSMEEAREFYVDFLGFTLDWGDASYAQISRSNVQIHLTENSGDANPGSAVYIRMSGLDAFHRELSGKNTRQPPPGITHTFYDAREFAITDPFGNRLRFVENNSPGVAAPQ